MYDKECGTEMKVTGKANVVEKEWGIQLCEVRECVLTYYAQQVVRDYETLPSIEGNNR